MSEIKSNLQENKKNAQILRSENISLEHTAKQKFNELIKNIMDSLSNLEKDFKRAIQTNRNETDFIKSQVQGLNSDKSKIQQSVININTRMTTCENEVGMPLIE